MDKRIEEISQRMIARYSSRYRKMGYDVKTLGWGTRDQQHARFDQVLKGNVDLQNKVLLDIGCGFGDLAGYLMQANVQFKQYKGWDLNLDLVSEAKKLWSRIPTVTFDVQNIAELETAEPIADVGIMLGLLNLNLQNEFDNYQYAEKLVTNAFKAVRECLIVDFLSADLTGSYPKEDFVFYYQPPKILELALSLSHNVQLKHDYAPIPQKEFIVFISK
jgi:SAM-dependent methyltransferase